MRMRCFLGCVLVAVLTGYGAAAQDPDAAYIERFLKAFKKNEPPAVLKDIASVARYDQDYLGDKLAAALKHVTNDNGAIAWGLAARMISLNEMYRATNDAKYLDANLECIRAVMAVRDDKLGTKLWTGAIAPAWSSDKYAKRGRAVFGVHTGMITYPMLDFLFLAKENKDYAVKLGDAFQAVLTCAEEALGYHDRQWRDGPGEGEGHYIMMEQEDGMDGRIKPGNRLSALGRSLWMSWKVTGNTTHRDRALAIGRYMKHRLTLGADGAYYWPYWLPLEPVTTQAERDSISGEDSSHAALTLSFPLMLASEGEVFNTEDMKRFGQTVLKGFGRKGGGILFGDITGKPASNPDHVASPARWLSLVSWTPEVRETIVSFYLNYTQALNAYDMALLIRYGS